MSFEDQLMPDQPDSFASKTFLEMLLEGNRSGCLAFARNYMSQRGSIKDLYENILKSSLYEVGELWEKNKITVATEHMASAIVEHVLNEFYYDIAFGEKHNQKVVVACVENEYHQIGIKMISDIFEMHGWESFFLGANVPASDLIAFIKKHKPDVLAISLSIYFHLPVLENMIAMIREEFPDLLIMVGGQAFRHGGKESISQFEHVVYQPDIKSTEKFIKSITI